MNEIKKPAIRFKGFSDEWEKRKVSELTGTVFGGGTPDTSNENYWSGNIPWIQSSNVIENQLFSVEVKKHISPIGLQQSAAQLIPANSIAVVSHVGVGKLVFMPFSYTTSQDFISLSYLKANPQFLCYTLYRKLQRDLYIVQGSAIKGITKEDLLEKELIIPKELEQIPIGTLIKNIDDLINLQQYKHSKLICLKKSMLGKMFPKDGADVPEIRFKEFSGIWHKCKIGECFTERNENLPDGELLSVTINSGVRKFSDLDRRDTSNQDKSKYKKVCIGDIAYNSMRMWQGASGYSAYEGIVSPAYTVLSPKPGIISECLAYYFKSAEMIHTFQINSQGITSDNWNLKFPQLSNIEIYVAPTIEEQKKISDYLTSLDALIQQSQKQLEKLQSIKKALLEKMFV